MSTPLVMDAVAPFLAIETTAQAADAEQAYRNACECLTRALATSHPDRPPNPLLLPNIVAKPPAALRWARLGQALAAMQLGFHRLSGVACLDAALLKHAGKLDLLYAACADVHLAWWHCRFGKYREARLACYEVLERTDALPVTASARIRAEAFFVLAYTAYRERRIREARGHLDQARGSAAEAWPGRNSPEMLLLTSGMNLPLLEHQIAVFESRWEDVETCLDRARLITDEVPHLSRKVDAKNARAQLYRHNEALAQDNCKSILEHAGVGEPEARLDALHYLARMALNAASHSTGAQVVEQLRLAEGYLQQADPVLGQVDNPREEIVFALLRAEWVRLAETSAVPIRTHPRTAHPADESRRWLERAESWQNRLPDDHTLRYKLHLVRARVARSGRQFGEADAQYLQAIAVQRQQRRSRLLAVMLAEYAEFLEGDSRKNADMFWAEAYDVVRHDPRDPLLSELLPRVNGWSSGKWCDILRKCSRTAVQDNAYLDRSLINARQVAADLVRGLGHELNHECNLVRDALSAGGAHLAEILPAQDRIRQLGSRFEELFTNWQLPAGTDPQEEDLIALARKALDTFAGRASHLLGRPIALVAPEPIPPVRVHGTYLEMAIGNLVRNALEEYEQHPGPTRPREIRISVRPERGGARIRVWNSGTRLEKEILERLFELGSTGKSKRGGSGKGLFFARLVATLCDGTICGGNVDGGVAFHITVPTSDG